MVSGYSLRLFAGSTATKSFAAGLTTGTLTSPRHQHTFGSGEGCNASRCGARCFDKLDVDVEREPKIGRSNSLSEAVGTKQIGSLVGHHRDLQIGATLLIGS